MEVKSVASDLGPEVPFYRNKVVGYFVLWGALGALALAGLGTALWFGGKEVVDALD